MRFSPIAIVGRACVLPGALSPDALWQIVHDGVDATSPVSPDRWNLDHDTAMAQPGGSTLQRTVSDQGGYVRGFAEIFDPIGFDGLSPRDVLRLDPLVQWVLHCGREALEGVQNPGRGAVVLGNLSFPTESMTRHAEARWLRQTGLDLSPGDGRNRFMSGLPAALVASGLGLQGPAFCLDSACASGLVALKHASDLLQDGQADMVLAGAVQRADALFLNVGFTALGALSPSGRSRPFHRDADGLIPAEGCVVFALKRLEDARRDGDTIHGILRGIGCSNDAKGTGLLAPNASGQVRAMRAAYDMAGLTPDDVQLVECHATGTQVGDAIEIASLSEVFAGRRDVPMGSLKSNLGHLIATAGAAAVLKMTLCMDHGVCPPTLHAWPSSAALEGGPFRLLGACEDWQPPDDGVRRAAISAFGFGGNNAHAILEQDGGQSLQPAAPAPHIDIAVVALAMHTAAGPTLADAERALFAGASLAGPDGAKVDEVVIPLMGLGVPPSDLDHALGQQLMVLQAGREALAGTRVNAARTGVYIGMGCDPEISRYGTRARLAGRLRDAGIEVSEAWLHEAREAISGPLQAAGVLGTMPNILANRLNHLADLGGGSGSMSAEELSGTVCLERAIRALQSGELDAALVGAADMCCEPVNILARAEVLGHHEAPGDAAVVLVLKRLQDAQRDGDTVHALVGGAPAGGERHLDHTRVASVFGHTGAASGLLAVACSVMELHRGDDAGHVVQIDSFSGQRQTVCLTRAAAPSASPWPVPAFAGPARAFAVHAPAVRLPVIDAPGLQPMPKPPILPASFEHHVVPAAAPASGHMAPPPGIAPATQAPPVTTHALAAPAPRGQTPMMATAPDSLLAAQQELIAQMGQAHQQWLQAQLQAQAAFMETMALEAPPIAGVQAYAPQMMLAAPQATPAPHATPAQQATPAPPNSVPAPSNGVHASSATHATAPTPASTTLPSAESFPGPALSRKDLEHLSSGAISTIFGPVFRAQDGYAKQTRMPRPPLLLADRVLGIDAPQAVLGKGVLWTETDVPDVDGWFMHNGRMPPGIMIESGQADLLLISWMGIDLLNKGERVYRLLGCDVTFKGSAPSPGETLRYAIHIDGHANQGPIRLMFFHYDCTVDGETRMEVRGGQAGFFTQKELDESAGILWDAAVDDRTFERPSAAPRFPLSSSSLDEAEVQALADGRLTQAFGPDWQGTLCHTRTPTIADGDMRFIDRVTELSFDGGPWGRGFLRCELDITPESWFFEGHFYNDPCMPGTLMLEGALQAMSIYMMAHGVTVDRDGWRFEPVPDHSVPLRCRGQVVPTSDKMILDVFVDTMIDDDGEIVLYADLLGWVDGLKAFHARRMGLRLVPDWPYTSLPMPTDPDPSRAVAEVDGFRFDHASLMNCALGAPSKAFGPMYERFDGPRTVPRLPGAPYHFMSRIREVNGAIGGMEEGSTVVAEYDVPGDAWYFAEHGVQVMPFCVLMEALLQPCGWLASYSGAALTTDEELAFRNLDGKGTVHSEVRPGERLTTSVLLHGIAKVGPMIIQRFTVQAKVEDRPVYDLETVFGFFPAEALASQKGLPASEAERAQLVAPCDERHEVTERPAPRFEGAPYVFTDTGIHLCMLDRITGYWPEAGEAGLGRSRGEKDVNLGEWMFAAHFFQDPVQPGSLGVEALAELVQWTMLRQGLHEGMGQPRFESVGLGAEHSWTYRGQVVGTNDVVIAEVELIEIRREGRGVLAIAKAWLWVDGRRIYHLPRLGMRLVDEGDDAVKAEVVRNGGEVISGTSLVEPGGAAHAFWDAHFDIGRWPTEDLTYGLVRRYVGDVVLEDSASLRALHGQGVLFLANHQTAVESWLFAILASGLFGLPTAALAKAEHRETWMGRISELCFSWPGVQDPEVMAHFDRDDAASLAGILEGLGAAMAANERNLLVHIDGTRSTHCAQPPVHKLASIFVELAVQTGVPIVPVRFVGGLPRQGSERLEFPVGHGRQDTWFGRPITASELRVLDLRARRALVLDAINGLGPAWQNEHPLAGDAQLAQEIEAWSQDRVVPAPHAALLAALRRVAEPHAVTRQVIAAADGGSVDTADDAEGAWVRELIGRLVG